MKSADGLLILGSAAVVSIGGIAAINRLHPFQKADHDNAMRVAPISESKPAQRIAADSVNQVSKIPETSTDKPQFGPKPGGTQEIPQKKRHLVAIVDNGDGTYRDVFEDQVSQLNPEDYAVSYTSPQYGQLPSQVTKILKSLDGPLGANILEWNQEMHRQIETGVHTAKGDLAEQLLRDKINSEPELRSLTYSVYCASRLCELQAVRAVPGVATESIDAALTRVSRTEEFVDQYRLRASLQLPLNDVPYWIWYWEKRE